MSKRGNLGRLAEDLNLERDADSCDLSIKEVLFVCLYFYVRFIAEGKIILYFK